MSADTKPTKKRAPKRLADFFVSYSSPNLRTARQMADWIAQTGFTTHLIEPGEGGGKSFPAAMNEAIERCDRLLAVYTQHYKNSAACTAEMEGMWRRDPDGRLGRILIVRLDATEVPALFATRDYWDFTKVPVEDVRDEFLRRMKAMKPVRSAKRLKSKAVVAPDSLSRETHETASVVMKMNLSGTGIKATQAGRDVVEHHYHTPKPPKVVLDRRGDEISNAQASDLRQKLGDWGKALWEFTKRNEGKSERAMHQQVQERFKRRMKIPRYDALEAWRFDEAIGYIRVEIAKLRPKLAKTNPAQANRAAIASIKQAMKSMGEVNETYYPELVRRLSLRPFSSLTKLSPTDLERAVRMARADARRGY